MPDIPLVNQAFDLVFHPTSPTVYVGLLTGEIKAFSYTADAPESEFRYTPVYTIRPTKRSCRGLTTNLDGTKLFSVSKDKTLHVIDTMTGKVLDARLGAHENPINRVAQLMPNMLSTGDDEGVIKLWDPRKPEAIRAYTHHFEFISDFLWLEDKKHLVATSADGTLSVLDVRASKTEPIAQSEDQEDELLSIAPVKNNTKVIVGTQLGILSVFNRSSGWGDCVDRVPGHPHSVDTLCPLPPSLSPTADILATGSSDGLIRLVQILPHKLLGVVADHGEFPVERIKIDSIAGGRWMGSVSHDESLKMTDLKDCLEESDEEGEEGEGKRDEDGEEDGMEGSVDGDSNAPGEVEVPQPMDTDDNVQKEPEEEQDAKIGDVRKAEAMTAASEDEVDSDAPKKKKRKKKKGKKKEGGGGGGGREVDKSFFQGL